MPLDLYLLATQGQFSLTGIISMPVGFYTVVIEEEIITTQRPGGSPVGTIRPEKEKKKKKIKLKFFQNNILEFEKEIIVSDIKVKVEDVKINENKNIIEVKLKSDTQVIIKEIKL